jgi:hypothetical protein
MLKVHTLKASGPSICSTSRYAGIANQAATYMGSFIRLGIGFHDFLSETANRVKRMLSASVQMRKRDPPARKNGSVQRIDLTQESNSCLLSNLLCAQWQLDSDAQMAENEEEAFQIAGARTGACASWTRTAFFPRVGARLAEYEHGQVSGPRVGAQLAESVYPS